MALITCKECGKQVSEYAKYCPDCGYPIAKSKKESSKSEKLAKIKDFTKSNKGKTFIIVLIAIIVITVATVIWWKNTCHNHVYNDFEILISATCEKPGKKQLLCSNCGKKGDITEIPIIDHKFKQTKVLKDVSCTENGKSLVTCSICGKEQEKIIFSTGHDYLPPTCTEPQTCKICGEIIGNPLGHNYINGVCTICGEQEPIHEFKSGETWVVDGLFEMTINGATNHYACNSFCNEDYAQVIQLSYMYKNIGYLGPMQDLFFSDNNISVVDQAGYIGTGYPCAFHSQHPVECAPGQACVVNKAFGLLNGSNSIKVSIEFWELGSDYSLIKIHKAIFEVPVQ